MILAAILIAVLTLTLSGCGREEQSLDGLYITTFELQGGTLETPTSSVSTKINFAYNFIFHIQNSFMVLLHLLLLFLIVFFKLP